MGWNDHLMADGYYHQCPVCGSWENDGEMLYDNDMGVEVCAGCFLHTPKAALKAVSNTASTGEEEG